MDLEVVNEIDKCVNVELKREKSEFEKILSNVIDKASNYIIKILPIQENLKDVIRDVKDAVKTKDMKKIIGTAINSSLREGMEFLGVSNDKIKDVLTFKDTLFRGGVRENICAGIDTAYSKYIKNNMFAEDLENFVDKLKENINSRDFMKNIDKKVDDISKSKQVVDNLCEKWYESYEKLDLNSINSINSQINSLKSNVFVSPQQQKNISIINNMTEFVNSKKDKLNPVELNFCNNV